MVSRIFYKSLLLLMIIAVMLSFASCGNTKKNDTYSTDSLKKFVESMKKNQKISGEKTKKTFKGVFPKIKID